MFCMRMRIAHLPERLFELCAHQFMIFCGAPTELGNRMRFGRIFCLRFSLSMQTVMQQQQKS